MKRTIILAAVAAVSVGLAACGTTREFVKDLTPDQKAALAGQFFDHCNGTIHFGAGAQAGLGGNAHGEFELTGTCGPQVVPLSQINKVFPGGGSFGGGGATAAPPPPPTLNDILPAG